MKTELTLLDGSTYCALPCPFCGGTSLTTDTWCFDDGEVDAITCRRCEGAALHTIWNQRKGCDYTAPPLNKTMNNECTCTKCGCTDSQACPGGCAWVTVDRENGIGICSSCIEPGATS